MNKNLSIERQLEISKKIADMVLTASNAMRYDGVRFKMTKKPIEAANIDELYKKSRTEYFDFDTKIKIMAGFYILSSENIQKYYFKALKIIKQFEVNE